MTTAIPIFPRLKAKRKTKKLAKALNHEVTVKEFLTASRNFHKLELPRNDHFSSFLGTTTYVLSDIASIRLTEASYNKVKMLNSEHYRTLFKAFQIRTGYQRVAP